MMLPAIRPYLIGGAAVGLGLFLLAFYLRGVELDACNATTEQIRTEGEKAQADAQAAIKRQADEAAKAERSRNRLLREIRDAKETDNALVAAVLGNALARLCDQGAAGCATE